MRCSKTSLVEKTRYAENGEKNGNVLLDNNSFAKDKLQLHWRCSVKQVLFNCSQNSQEKTCDGVSLFLETSLKSYSSTVVLLFNFSRFFKDTYHVEHLLRTITSDRASFSRSASKISNASDIYCSYCYSEMKLTSHKQFNQKPY